MYIVKRVVVFTDCDASFESFDWRAIEEVGVADSLVSWFCVELGGATVLIWLIWRSVALKSLLLLSLVFALLYAFLPFLQKL